MGLFSCKSDRRDVDTSPGTQTDQYRLKATGRRVTVLEYLSGGDVRIAMDNGHTTRDDIVSSRDITPV